MRRSGRVAALAGGLAAGLLVAAPLPAQPRDVIPGLPAGTPVVVLPVQAALPAADGGWPGGLGSESEVLEALSAEIAFALDELREASAWASPADVVRRAARNPLLGVDPARVAYQGLLAKPKARQIYEPLHGQLRALAALFDARFVVLPLAVQEAPLDPVPAASGGPAAGGDARDDGPPGGGRPDGTPVRGALLVALIDIRRSELLWHGEIPGPAVLRGSPAALAALAQRVVRTLVTS